MKAIILIVSSLFCFVTAPAWAQVYERNTARPVNQVVFGQVETVRNITQRQILESEHSGWKTLGAPSWAVCLATSLVAVMAVKSLLRSAHWRGRLRRSSINRAVPWWKTSWWSCLFATNKMGW